VAAFDIFPFSFYGSLSILPAPVRLILERKNVKKYMLLMYFEENTSVTEEQRQECYLESAAFAQNLAANGQFVTAAPLQPTSTATSLRLENGKRLITDGPFAETREQLGGFFIVNARDLDEAIDIAARVPAGRWGTVEIRPIVEVPTLPKT
jgi:hypothetical protein